MARIFLKAEVQAAIRAAIEKLQRASDVIETTERNVQDGIKAHLSVAAVNAIGTEGYEAGGVLIADAIALVTNLGADASTGLAFPKIAAIGSPLGFDRVHVDSKGGGSAFGAITAYSKTQIGATIAPWGSISAGNKVLIQKINPTIGSPVDLEGIEGLIMTVDSIDTSNTRLVFTAAFVFYEGENQITHDEADAGGESDTCVLRVVDA
jgi:hypothetical protein